MEQMNENQHATETELIPLVEDARHAVAEQMKKLNEASDTLANAQRRLATARAAAQHNQKLAEEKQQAQEISQRLTALTEEAQRLVVEKIQELHGAVERAEGLLAEARAAAHQFNLDVGRTLVFDENFSIPIRGLSASYWLQQNIPPGYVHVSGKTQPQPGQRVRLRDNVRYRDYPPRSSVAVSRSEADRLLQRSVADPV